MSQNYDLVITKVNEVFFRIQADPSIKTELNDFFSFRPPGYQFAPSYKNRYWDGYIRIFKPIQGLLYIGLLNHVKHFCKTRNYTYKIDDSLVIHNEIPKDIGFQLAKKFNLAFTPRDYQNEAVYQCIVSERKVIESATGSGKSLAIAIIAQHFMSMGKKVLIIVPTTSLVHQLAGDIQDYNHGKNIGVYKITGGIEKSTHLPITISTWQSIASKKTSPEFLKQYDCVIGDECHLFAAKSLTTIMEKLDHCRYRFGFTGSLQDSKCHRLILEGLFGSVYTAAKSAELIREGTLANLTINAIVLQYPKSQCKEIISKTYQEEIDFIVRNEKRNLYICNLADKLKGNTLILFQYVDKHGKVLNDLLREKTSKHIHFVFGDTEAIERERVRAVVEQSTDNIILASAGVYSTGVNIKNLNSIIFASPSKSKIRNLQSIGRGLRKSETKTEATLYDIVDDLKYGRKHNYAYKHFQERLNIYTSEQFPFKIYNIQLKE